MDIFNEDRKSESQKDRKTLPLILNFFSDFRLSDKHTNMDLLRFITAGSVDDGKSTLIGRLLYDSKNILIDQLEALENQQRIKRMGKLISLY